MSFFLNSFIIYYLFSHHSSIGIAGVGLSVARRSQTDHWWSAYLRRWIRHSGLQHIDRCVNKIRAYMRTFMRACVCAFACVYVCVCSCGRAYMRVFMCARPRVCAPACMRARVCTVILTKTKRVHRNQRSRICCFTLYCILARKV